MSQQRIYLSPPHMGGKELEYIQEAFASNWIAPVGPHVEAFEREFCGLINAQYATAVSSGTAALHLALMLSKVGKGDPVACSTFTFAGSVFPVAYVGAEPIFIDSESRSWNIDPNLFEDAAKAWKKKGKPIKAVIVVHLYGQSADLDPLLDICERYAITLIEDCAESLGATYKGKYTGTVGSIGIFSFNGNKIATTSGGGMLVSEDRSMMEKARFLATQARDPFPYYEHSSIGYNYRLSNICAAIGRGQLSVLKERIDKKREIFNYYYRELSSFQGISFMPEVSYGQCNRWLTCLTIEPKVFGKTPERVRLSLEKENIESRPLWKPMHLQPIFKQYPAFVKGVSEALFLRGICLPSGTSLTDEDLKRIVHCILNA